MGRDECAVRKTTDILTAFLEEKGFCNHCYHNFVSVLGLLIGIGQGEAVPGDLTLIEELSRSAVISCRCGRAGEVADKFLTVLQSHRDDFIVHIENRVCPAGQCPRLIPAPCQAACPAGIDIPNYVALVGQGRYREALELIREDVPLPGVLGRICEHPCQQACRRGQVDNPIPICSLKRLAYDRGAEKEAPPPPERKHPERVAVVGAGP
ncbi:MAG TPA: pyridine nucleotide-disulfide oxidoreductase, partial [Desulfotomaculum sp.]|nr:pyridine nucleotide-disulfide oxidoreductase [Desulfotomaculum sp.]